MDCFDYSLSEDFNSSNLTIFKKALEAVLLYKSFSGSAMRYEEGQTNLEVVEIVVYKSSNPRRPMRKTRLKDISMSLKD